MNTRVLLDFINELNITWISANLVVCYDLLYNCTTVVQASNSMTALTLSLNPQAGALSLA